jgi:hypothetical protein
MKSNEIPEEEMKEMMKAADLIVKKACPDDYTKENRVTTIMAAAVISVAIPKYYQRAIVEIAMMTVKEATKMITDFEGDCTDEKLERGIAKVVQGVFNAAMPPFKEGEAAGEGIQMFTDAVKHIAMTSQAAAEELISRDSELSVEFAKWKLENMNKESDLSRN